MSIFFKAVIIICALLAPLADYLVVNVSSPNTPGLRGLQELDQLGPLLAAVRGVTGSTPLLVKIAPDLDDEQVAGVSRLAVELGLDGTLVSYCVVNLDFTGNAQEIPYVSGLILVDGSDIPIYGLVREIPYDEVGVGLRLKSAWVEDSELTTSFENIKWWAPNGEPDVPRSDLTDYI